jgi:hypothetical protein
MQHDNSQTNITQNLSDSNKGKTPTKANNEQKKCLMEYRTSSVYGLETPQPVQLINKTENTDTPAKQTQPEPLEKTSNIGMFPKQANPETFDDMLTSLANRAGLY